jgi:hypothetical protein
MSINWKIAWRLAAVAVAAVTLAVCGGSSSDDGAGGPSVPVVPTPTPAPTPAAETPLAVSCNNLSPGSLSHRCLSTGATFQRELEDSISLLKAQKPQIFDGERVTNVGAYVVGVIKNLDAKGVCATYDGEELAVRSQGDFNDQYDILTSGDLIRRYYVNTCVPAVFPLSRNPLPPPPGGCTLGPSYEVACGVPPSEYIDDVNGAVEQLQKDKPELFDAGNVAPGRQWPAIKDFPAYYQGVIEILARKGYCGRFSGEELEVKRTNEFSESFDINYQDKYVRLGPGIYQSACYPAQF